jgi:hypothetical protein
VLVSISAPSSEAYNVFIQASPTVIAPSTGGVVNVSDLKLEVTNKTNQVVSGAKIGLTMLNTAAGGEYISPSALYSDASGQATATFHAGSLVSDSKGILCVARLLEPGVPETGALANVFSFDSTLKTITRSDAGSFVVDGFQDGDRILVTGSALNDWVYQIALGGVAAGTLTLTDDPMIRGDNLVNEAASAANEVNIEKVDAAQVVIGGTASSVSIGMPTTVVIDGPTIYRIPMSVLVSDSNGNPVNGATVNLSVWPIIYWTGWSDTTTGPQYCFWYDNEDLNRNEVLDPGEDLNAFTPGYNNGVLDPAKATAGAIPATVVTDENGVAEFDYYWQKVFAIWTNVEIRASVVVYGSETIATVYYGRVYAESEKKNLPSSPWGCDCLSCP